MPLNSYISLYEREDGENPLYDLPAPREDDPERHFFDQVNEQELEQLIGQELSPLEKQVLDLAIIGMTSAEAARVLNKSEKSTDNALQRARMKIRRLIGRKKE